MSKLHRLIQAAVLGSLVGFSAPAAAQVRPETPQIASNCLAVAQSLPGARYASLSAKPAPPRRPAQSTRASALDATATITYAGHSTYLIESPDGVRIATDFGGAYGLDFHPRIITMNKAHRSHFTDSPPPDVEYVLRGWSPEGGAVHHRLRAGDVTVRNVTTDIRDWSGGLERDGNSIFIFETAGLCIGHLGHLHTSLSDRQFAEIGRLDVLMTPVDGGLTQSISDISQVARRLSALIILPMHRQRTPISQFTAAMGDRFAVEYRPERSISVSLNALPRQPTIVILDGV